MGVGGCEIKTSQWWIKPSHQRPDLLWNIFIPPFFFLFKKKSQGLWVTLSKLPEDLLQFLAFEWNFSGILPEAESLVWFGFVFFAQETCWQTDQAEPCFKRLLNLLSSHRAVKLVLRRLHFLSESFWMKVLAAAHYSFRGWHPFSILLHFEYHFSSFLGSAVTLLWRDSNCQSWNILWNQ